MGIVKRQGIKFSIVGYVALFLGTINVLFIYPYALQPEELGLMRFILDTALLVVPFVSLGFGNVIIRYFPQFQDKAKSHNGFLLFVFLVPFAAFLIFLLAITLLKEPIYDFYSQKNELFRSYLFFVVPVIGFMLFSTLSRSYSYNFQRIVVPNILNSLMVKAMLPCLALLYFFNVLSLNQMMTGVVAVFGLVLVGSILYLGFLGQLSFKPNWSFLTKTRIKDIRTYAFYGILSGVGSVLALRIDTFMLASLVSLEMTGIYSIAIFISGVIAIPYIAMSNISSAIISKAWAENDISTIDQIYKKSSLVLLIAGCFIFLLIWVSLDDFFAIMPNGEKYISGKNIVLILGVAKLIDVTASLNDHIINYSKYFKIGFVAIMILAVLNLVNNIILIPQFQMLGAAYATLISITLFNLFKLIFIKVKVNIQPLSIKTVYVILIALLSYLVLFFSPDLQNPFFNILVNGFLLTVVFLGPVIYLKISEDFNDVILKMLNRIKSVF
ncbi:MAG: polysaccharide biosynthesis C-terminal domain-containing protein [Bacteroidia bacterium]|nr:polysaccharide biosynthesis C-terminal domain-containing protein [Bacteroidia bacterium]